MITAKEKDELKTLCGKIAIAVIFEEAAIRAQQLELIKDNRKK